MQAVMAQACLGLCRLPVGNMIWIRKYYVYESFLDFFAESIYEFEAELSKKISLKNTKLGRLQSSVCKDNGPFKPEMNFFKNTLMAYCMFLRF